jgi:hypothetical protein
MAGMLLLVITAAAEAQDKAGPVRKSLGAEGDCSETRLLFQDRSDLTQAERLALMEKALLRSLSRFDACQTGAAMQGGAGGGGGGSGSGNAGAAGGGGAAGTEGQGGNVGSVAASDMKGTEPQEQAAKPSSDKDKGEKSEKSSEQDGTTSKDGKGVIAQAAGSGKAPEDIPPANNDSVLEAQIRRAAESESDPEKAKKLWNEYRRYKGLPAK